VNFSELMKALAAAASKGDGAAVADLFTADGVYHDVFYGSFTGADAIRDMIDNYFHRDGQDFLWDMHDAVAENGIGYARYVFSYQSRLPDCQGRRGMFEGISIIRYNENGKILDYREVAESGVGLSLLGFSDERIARFLAKEAAALKARPESRAHVERT
jgi:hypothetical protein